MATAAFSEGLFHTEKSEDIKCIASASPSESESESGISSLCSDDFKKQSISEDGDGQRLSDNENNKADQQIFLQEVTPEPKLMYQNRDILDLSHLRSNEKFIQFTVLPQNNLACFFQNRSQYYRLNSNEPYQNSVETCNRCKFQSPFPQQYIHGPPKDQNDITKGLLKFIKDYEQSNQMTACVNFANIQPFMYQNHNQPYFANNYNNSQRYNPQANSCLALLSLMNNEATANALLSSLSASTM